MSTAAPHHTHQTDHPHGVAARSNRRIVLPAVAPFAAPTLLRNRHIQTLLPFVMSRPELPPVTTHEVALPDGDRVVLHDDRPAEWRPGDSVLLLLHGLTGCHQSSYMVRCAMKAAACGIRCLRLDHRGTGAGRGLAKNTYHAGQSDDVRCVLRRLETLCPTSPVGVAGFSLSGNLVLKLLGESPDSVPVNVHRVAAVSPPVDLSGCVRHLGKSALGRRYDRQFARWLVQQVADSPQWRDDVPLATASGPVRRVVEFDELYTAPAAGFRDVAHYYAEASAAPLIDNIQVPTLILAARDDPMVPFGTFRRLRPPACVQLDTPRHGGHLGFYSRRTLGPDRYWMDWRVLSFLFGDQSSTRHDPPATR